MKIGIFDPNLDSKGHFLPFNRHIIKLLQDKNNRIIFFDIADILKNSCQEKNIEFINVADTPMAELSGELITLSDRFVFLAKEFFWYREVYKKISRWQSHRGSSTESGQKNKIDFLIITSLGYFFFDFFIPKVKFAAILHTSDILVFEKKHSIKYFMQVLKKWVALKFLCQAEVVFTLDEYLKDKISIFNFKNTEWMPYTCFENPGSGVYSEKKIKEFTLLTPGAIYRGKNIDFVLDVYKKYNLNFKYIIVGFPIGVYGRKIVKTVESLEKNTLITGIFRYLPDEEYKEMIQRSSFVLLPYSKERSNGISAVMHDAFENNTPIIAPNMRPFNYYVNKYSLGLLYAPNEESFISVLKKASKIDTSIYKDNFEKFKKDFSYSKTQKKIRRIIAK